jgi:hypothetical protein
MTLTKKQQYWKAHLDALEEFAGTAADYARLKDLNPKKLYVYKTKLRTLQAASTPNRSSFVEVKAALMPNPASTEVVVALPNGVRLLIPNLALPDLLEDLAGL